MRRFLLFFATAAAVGALASPAAAEFGIEEFDVTFTGADGSTVSQAGAHPFAMTTSIRFNSTPTGEGGAFADEAVKDLLISQVPGFIGNPTAVPRCTTDDFLTAFPIEPHPGTGETLGVPDCPDAAALGFVSVTLASKVVSAPLSGAIYNLQPPPGVAAKLGFWISGFPVTVELGVGESFPYNIIGGPSNISQVLEVIGAELTIWGNPAASVHDPFRGHCLGTALAESIGNCKANIPSVPFLTLPRACVGPLNTAYKTDSWLHPGVFKEGFAETHDSFGVPAGLTGCGKLDFGPEVDIGPTIGSAESASGLDLEIDVADEGLTNPDGIAQADIEATEFAFPRGVTVNPSAAEGLGVCTKAQYEAARLTVQGCPDAAKLGSLEVDTPILENHTLKGDFYLAQQDDPSTSQPEAENPFDSLLAAYLMIRDPELGVFAKLATEIETDEATGQIVARTEEMPPFPLSRVKLHLRTGPRAPLITPPTCGSYSTEAVLYPSTGAEPLETASTFRIASGPGGGPCPSGGLPPFDPSFEAGSASNAASAYSPFSLRLTRRDGEQDLTRFSAVLAPGVTGKLAGVAKCPDSQIAAARSKSGRAEQAAPSCPASSQIGTVLGGAGVGTALTYVPGSLYLAGPYNGAPLSVAAIVPAVAGPFDVGTVVTRVALDLNPTTGQIEVDGAASDPIPHILKGIPLKLRDLRVYTDRPNFTLNPTGCEPSATVAQIFGAFADPFNPADDVALTRSSRYQAASCASLRFKPNLAQQLKGGTKRNRHPALHVTVTYPYPSGPGYSNIGKAVVTLPRSEFLDPNHVNNPCTRVQFKAGACPQSSVLGTAKAITPLLDEPLEGPVYFLANGGQRALPDVVADLHGLVHITLVGKVDAVVHGESSRIRTTFDELPDEPVTKFTLTLKGGKKYGVLVNSSNICKQKPRANVQLTGQNGRRYDTEPVIKTSCKGTKTPKHKGAKHQP